MGLAIKGDNIGICKACIKDADSLKDPTLFPLFAELNILVIRPAAVEGGKYLSRRFTKRYTVRRSAITQWLYFLKANHPNYHNIKIYSTWLTSLPKNSFILDQ